MKNLVNSVVMWHGIIIPNILNFFVCVIVSMLTSSVVDCEFEPRSGQTKDYKIGVCCFSPKYTALRRRAKTCWLRIMCMWSNISTLRLLFQWATTIKIQLCVLVYYKADLIVISLNINLFSPWYSWKIAK
jgi:hypothetical protein